MYLDQARKILSYTFVIVFFIRMVPQYIRNWREKYLRFISKSDFRSSELFSMFRMQNKNIVTKCTFAPRDNFLNYVVRQSISDEVGIQLAYIHIGITFLILLHLYCIF